MRWRWFLSSLAGVAWLMVSPAQGGVLTQATWTQTVSGVSLVITNSAATCTSIGPNIVQQMISCPGTGLDATGFAFPGSGSGDPGIISVALTMPAFALKQFTTGGVLDVYTKLTLGNSGQVVIEGDTNGPSASGGVAGMVTVKNTMHVATGLNASKRAPGFTTLVRIPLSVGKRGPTAAFFYLQREPHYLTLDFYRWTPNTWIFYELTSKFAPLAEPTVVAMGSFALTARGQGTVTLVSPTRISIDGPLAQRHTVSFTTLKLTFVPEPSTLLLLGAGAACLGLTRGRSRARSALSER